MNEELLPPKEALYLLTFSCDKECSYCFNESNIFGYKSNGNGFVRDQPALIEKLKRLNVKKVYLSGGEPSLHSEFGKISQAMIASFQTSVFTGGHLFERYDSIELDNFGFRSINVSLDPFKSGGLGDSLRDQDQSTRIKLREFYRLPNRQTPVTILSTVSLDNINELEHFMNQDYVQGADRVIFQPMSLPENHPFYPLTFDAMPVHEVEKALEILDNYSSQDSHIEAFRKFYLRKGILPPCLMGINYLQINPDGQIFGCPHNKSELISDNILEDSVEVVLSRLHNANGKKYSTNTCLSSRCLCLHDHLNKRYGNDEKE